MSDVLSKEDVRQVRAWQTPDSEVDRDLRDLADSHEALRAALASAENKVDGLEMARSAWQDRAAKAESDLAAARAEVERLTRELSNPVRYGVCETCMEKSVKTADAALSREAKMREALKNALDCDLERALAVDELRELRKADCPNGPVLSAAEVRADQTYRACVKAKAEAHKALDTASSPSPSCPSCERLRDVLRRVIGHVQSSLTVEHGDHGTISQVVRYDRTIADELPADLRAEAEAAIAHAEKEGSGR